MHLPGQAGPQWTARARFGSLPPCQSHLLPGALGCTQPVLVHCRIPRPPPPPRRIPNDGNKARYIAKPGGCQPDGLYSDGTSCEYTPEMRRWDYFKKVRRWPPGRGWGTPKKCQQHAVLGASEASLAGSLVSRQAGSASLSHALRSACSAHSTPPARLPSLQRQRSSALACPALAPRLRAGGVRPRHLCHRRQV